MNQSPGYRERMVKMGAAVVLTPVVFMVAFWLGLIKAPDWQAVGWFGGLAGIIVLVGAMLVGFLIVRGIPVVPGTILATLAGAGAALALCSFIRPEVVMSWATSIPWLGVILIFLASFML